MNQTMLRALALTVAAALLVFGLGLMPAVARAEQTQEELNEQIFAALPKVDSILAEDAILNGILLGAGAVTVDIIEVDDDSLPFMQAARITTIAEAEQVYTYQYQLVPNKAVKKGDVMLAVFYARGVSSSEMLADPYVNLVFEVNGSPYTKSFNTSIRMGTDEGWKKYYIPFVCAGDYDAGTANFKIRMGYKPQVFDMADVRLYNYGNQVQVADLPKLCATYRGREDGAQWRRDALERIEQIRKSDFEILVLDGSGQPLPDVQVKVEMKRHAFQFGTAVASNVLLGSSPDAVKYREYLLKYFNSAVIENDLKWRHWEQYLVKPVAAVDKLREMGLNVRGHNLVWDNFSVFLPPDLVTLKDDPEAMQARTLGHITEITSALRGKLIDWDVINEGVNQRDMRSILGDAAAAEWFMQARLIDPYSKIYLNDTAISGVPTYALDNFEKMLRSLQANGAPVDGVGVEGHYHFIPANPEAILAEIDKIAPYVSEMKITEYDFETWDEQLQADFTRDILIACYSHPAMNGFYIWGFWDGAHWAGDAPLFTKDWQLKESGKVYEDLVLNQFWTNEQGKTDSEGKFSGRGFHGDYIVSVNYQGKEYRKAVSLKPGEACPVVFNINSHLDSECLFDYQLIRQDSNVMALIKGSNYSQSEDRPVTVIMAVYDSGRLESIQTKPSIIKKASQNQDIAELTADAGPDKTVKLMIWDSIDGMRPLAEEQTIK